MRPLFNPVRNQRGTAGFALRFALLFLALHTAWTLARGTALERFVIHTLTVRPGVWLINLIAPAEQVVAQGAILKSLRASLTVLNGCEGLESLFLIGAAVLAFACPWRHRLTGLLLGAGLIYLLNQLRIVVLWFCFRHQRDWFDLIHGTVGPTLIVMAGCCFFLLWTAAVSAPPAAPGLSFRKPKGRWSWRH